MNRAQKRLEEKLNRKVEITEQQRQFNEKVRAHYQRELDALVAKYNKELEQLEQELEEERKSNLTNDWFWFYANLCLTLKEDYHKNNDYISKFVTKMENRLRAFKDSDVTRDELIRECQEKCDIMLCEEEESEEA